MKWFNKAGQFKTNSLKHWIAFLCKITPLAYSKATKATKSEANKTKETSGKGTRKKGKEEMRLPLWARVCSFTMAVKTQSCCLRRQLHNSLSCSKLRLFFIDPSGSSTSWASRTPLYSTLLSERFAVPLQCFVPVSTAWDTLHPGKKRFFFKVKNENLDVGKLGL